MQDQRGPSAEKARQEVLASCCQAVIRRADFLGGVECDGVGGWLRALLQDPPESRAERSVLIISVCERGSALELLTIAVCFLVFGCDVIVMCVFNTATLNPLTGTQKQNRPPLVGTQPFLVLVKC